MMFKHIYLTAFIILNAQIIKTYGEIKMERNSATMRKMMTYQHWFPSNIDFNNDCLSKDCPALNSFTLCPNKPNTNKILEILQVITKCMTKAICGFTIEPRPAMSPVKKVKTLPGSGGVSTCIIQYGSLANASNIKFFTLGLSDGLPIQLSMRIANMGTHGISHCESTSKLNVAWPYSSNQKLPMTTRLFTATYNFASIIYINPSPTNSNFDIRVRNPKIKSDFSTFSLKTDPLLKTTDIFSNRMVNSLEEHSLLRIILATFYENLFQSAFKFVSKTCK